MGPIRPPEFEPIDLAAQKQWLLGEDVPGVKYKMCQLVEIQSGPDAGTRGQLISIASLRPEPLFHVETVNNEDLYIAQSQLFAIAA